MRGYRSDLPHSILCLDLGSKTGWAVLSVDPNGLPMSEWGCELAASGVVDFGKSQFEGAGMRFRKFQSWLLELSFSDMFDGRHLAAVYFESVRRHNGTAAAHVYGGLSAILMAWCETGNKIPYQSVAVANIKQAATGKGNANKAAIIDAVAKHYGIAVKDDNHADALALTMWYQKKMERGYI